MRDANNGREVLTDENYEAWERERERRNREYSAGVPRPRCVKERATPSKHVSSKPADLADAKRRSDGRFQCMNLFADEGIRQASLKASEGLVWFILFRDVRPDGMARSSIASLARRANLHKRTVMKALERLKGLGMLSIVERGGPTKGATTYRVNPVPNPKTGRGEKCT